MTRNTPVELGAAEVDLLGRVLRGERRTTSSRAATRLVRLRLAVWSEPDGVLELTGTGQEAARRLWPDVQRCVPERYVAEEPPPVRPQLLLVDPEQRNDPPEGLRGHLASLLRSEDLASVVLDHFPLGRGLDTATEDALVSIGLPRAAAGTVVHAMAVARTASDPQRVAPRIDSPEAMAAWLHRVKHVQHLETEHMWVCSLDAAHRLLEVRAVAAGSLTRVEAHMRDIFTPLLRVRAAACYLAHNHPSGEMRASVHDIRTAQRVDATARLFEIAMVDAMIVGPDGSFLSFRREGLL